MFDAVLIANRGEIAVRVARACRELGVRAVGVYSDADRDAPHLEHCDDAFHLGPSAPASSYLDVDRLLAIAERTGVDAVHPGYGFLSEDASFAESVAAAGMTFIGPPPAAIRAMGDKLSARAVAIEAGVPVVPGTDTPVDDPAAAAAFGTSHGYPVAVKAMFGGGGRGLRVVDDEDGLAAALAAAQREASVSFGHGECYLERYLPSPRHIEVQLLADRGGEVIHLGLRDCSLQRRHQKLVEEAPPIRLDPSVARALADAAVRIARTVGYEGAGTCEFLVEPDGRFHFLELNARLQVEHPVTELVTGIDLVHAQLRIAAGDGLGLTQDDVHLRGHAIEVRINAEDPANGFLPNPGRIDRLVVPDGPWTRFDSGVQAGWTVPDAYDTLLGKLVVWGPDRETARRRLVRALDELTVDGVATTIAFQRLATTSPAFIEASHNTRTVEDDLDPGSLPSTGTSPADGSAQVAPPGRSLTIEVDGRRLQVQVFGGWPQEPGTPSPVARSPRPRGGSGVAVGSRADALTAPMQGTVLALTVTAGDRVTAGDPVLVLEAMKMENPVTAHRSGVVEALPVAVGDVVAAGTVLARISDGSDPA